MKIQEIFKKYSGDEKFIRISKPHVSGLSIEFLKNMFAWCNQESIDMGFCIQKFMIEDVNANDWVLAGDKNKDE